MSWIVNKNVKLTLVFFLKIQQAATWIVDGYMIL